jgi:hypothetical protein
VVYGNERIYELKNCSAVMKSDTSDLAESLASKKLARGRLHEDSRNPSNEV